MARRYYILSYLVMPTLVSSLHRPPAKTPPPPMLKHLRPFRSLYARTAAFSIDISFSFRHNTYIICHYILLLLYRRSKFMMRNTPCSITILSVSPSHATPQIIYHFSGTRRYQFKLKFLSPALTHYLLSQHTYHTRHRFISRAIYRRAHAIIVGLS